MKINREKTECQQDILHYTKTKGAVDTIDKLAKDCTTQRKSNRWPMVIFFQQLEIDGFKAHKLGQLKKSDSKKNRLDRRRMFLFELC